MKIKHWLILILLIVTGVAFWGYYSIYKGAALGIKSKTYFIVQRGDSLSDLATHLEQQAGLRNKMIFIKVAQRMNLQRHMKSGRYQLEPEMTMVEVIRLFRSGKTKTVDFVLPAYIGAPELAALCGERLEPDAGNFLQAFQDDSLLAKYGFNSTTFLLLPLPDTYNLYWHTSPEEFIERMSKEYERFWNEDRRARAGLSNLSVQEVGILASIVCKETVQKDEMPIVAGLYLNRLRIGKKLEADPTSVFASDSVGITRVTAEQTSIKSPFNTYDVAGLPPGPLCIAPKRAITAVLSPARHDYLYMCAKPELDGYHNFSKDFETHKRNAAAYRRAYREWEARQAERGGR